MKKAYVTLINSESYLKGLFVLYESLAKTKTDIPLVVFLPKRTPEKVKNSILSYSKKSDNYSCKLLIKESEKDVILPQEVEDKNVSHWNGTLDKFLIFELTEYDKLVFIDSDMIVLNNVDHLFEKEHLSANNSGQKYPNCESWTELNSGLMVIKPKENESEKLINSIPKVMENKNQFGDQDVINFAYPFWKESDHLHLTEQYNLFYYMASYYKKRFKYTIRKNKPSTLYIVHFVGNKKPWNTDEKTNVYLKDQAKNGLIQHKNFLMLSVLKRYEKLLKKVEKKLAIN